MLACKIALLIVCRGYTMNPPAPPSECAHMWVLLLFTHISVLNSDIFLPLMCANASLDQDSEIEETRQQISLLFKSFSASFLWSFFQWFYTAGGDCGFTAFPTFGLKAYENRFYFDFSATYVGVGMICPYLINISLLLGSIISWGILWPYINSKKGEWYDAALPNDSLHGLIGY